MALQDFSDMGILGKLGFVLQNTADPTYLGKYQQALQDQEEFNLRKAEIERQNQQRSALAAIASDPSFSAMPLQDQLARYASITGDPSAMFEYQQNREITPYQQAQLGLERQRLSQANTPNMQFVDGGYSFNPRTGALARLDGYNKPLDPNASVPGIGIEPGSTPTAEDAKAVKTVLQAKKQLDVLTDQYRELISQYGTESDGTVAADQMKQKAAQITLQMKNLEELGALQEPDRKIIEDMLGSPVLTGWEKYNPYKRMTGKESALSRVDDFQNYINDRQNNALTTRGYIPPVTGGDGWSIRKKP